MDSLLGTAARALAVGDPLGALKCVALRSDPPALALRGIALAQLGQYAVARRLLQRAQRGFGKGEVVAKARCLTAEAEIALLTHDLREFQKPLERASRELEARGDVANALFARLLVIRGLLAVGKVGAAAQGLAKLSLSGVPARLCAVAELLRADVAVLELRSRDAAEAVESAARAAENAGIPPLRSEVERARTELHAVAARLASGDAETPLRLAEVEELLRSGAFVIDACRRSVVVGNASVSLVTRPVLFALALALGAAAPMDATRNALIASAFGASRPNDSHRARLRVEIGRLRRALASVAELRATPNGFALIPRRAARVVRLLPPSESETSSLSALLAGGEAWSSSALAAALGKSQRSVQRALLELEAAGRVRALGRGRSRRWLAPESTGITTAMLLVARGALG